MAEFQIGFYATGRILLRIAGGCAAALLLVVAVLMVLGLAAAVFDRITNRLAKRWGKKGHKPRNRVERIILDSTRDRGG